MPPALFLKLQMKKELNQKRTDKVENNRKKWSADDEVDG